MKKLNISGKYMNRFSFITEDQSDSDQSVNIPSNFFTNMPNIEALNLRHNKLTSIPDLSTLKDLKSLNLRGNDITQVPPNSLSHNPQLSSIGLTNNKISTITPTSFPESVEHLELNGNDISYLNSSMFSNLKSLKRLFLNGNKLDNIDSDTFDGMPALETLLLYNSRMTQFPNFNDLPKLVNLTISNAIRYTILSETKNEKNGREVVTTTLPPDYLPENTLVLKNLPSLQNLDLTLNHFTSLPVLENLPKLTSIDLKRNEISVIEPGAFSGLPGLKN